MKISVSKLSCAICQPHYLPWIGYFEMIDRVDVFVFLDDVQFIKREWKNRNRIRKTPKDDEAKWLTAPIVKDTQRGLIKDALLSMDNDWVSEHCGSLQSVYRYTPYFFKYFFEIQKILTLHSNGTLGNLNISIIEYICRELGIKTKLIKSSELQAQGKREEKLLNICKILKADFYLANNATGKYVKADYFQSQGIVFDLQNYKHPSYLQKYKENILPFISNLSIVDLLFNCGDESLEIIRRGRSSR